MVRIVELRDQGVQANMQGNPEAQKPTMGTGVFLRKHVVTFPQEVCRESASQEAKVCNVGIQYPTKLPADVEKVHSVALKALSGLTISSNGGLGFKEITAPTSI